MIIVFDKLLLDCIHNSILHNRLREDKLRSVLSILLKTLAKYNDETLAEIKRTRNCHFINYGTKTKIIKLFSQYARKSEVKLLVSQSDLYQLSIPNTEIRLIGALQPNYFHAKEKVYNDLFSVLFIDFDHSLHKNIGKLKAKRVDLLCIMEEGNCPDY